MVPYLPEIFLYVGESRDCNMDFTRFPEILGGQRLVYTDLSATCRPAGPVIGSPLLNDEATIVQLPIDVTSANPRVYTVSVTVKTTTGKQLGGVARLTVLARE